MIFYLKHNYPILTGDEKEIFDLLLTVNLKQVTVSLKISLTKQILSY